MPNNGCSCLNSEVFLISLDKGFRLLRVGRSGHLRVLLRTSAHRPQNAHCVALRVLCTPGIRLDVRDHRNVLLRKRIFQLAFLRGVVRSSRDLVAVDNGGIRKPRTADAREPIKRRVHVGNPVNVIIIPNSAREFALGSEPNANFIPGIPLKIPDTYLRTVIVIIRK
jgi:hypothetical protein